MNRKATILAVDDTSPSRQLMVDVLTRAGYQVHSADSGESALSAAADHPPDLLVLKVRLEGMDGLEVCRRLKAKDQTRHIPILLVSTFTDEKDWTAGLQLGAADYVNTPLRAEELLTRVKTQLALTRAANALRFLDASPDLLVTLGPDGRVFDANAAVERATGLPLAQLIGTEFASYFTDPDQARSVYRQVLRDDEVRDVPLQLRHGGRRMRDVLYNASVHRGEGGEILGVFASARDVTERKQAEFLLRARVELAEVAATQDADAVLQYALDAAERLTGSEIGFFHFVDDDQVHLTLQTWSTRTLQTLCTAEGKGSHYPVEQAGVWADCVRTRSPVLHNDYASLPHRKGLPSGHAPVVRELVVPILSGGKLVAIVGVGNKTAEYSENDANPVRELGSMALEVVARKRAEAQLRESEERYRVLFETMTHGVVRQNEKGEITAANPAAETLLGLTLDQMTGRTSTDPNWRATREDGSDFPGEDHAAMVALRTGKAVRGVMMGVFDPVQGTRRWLLVSAVPQFRAGESKPFCVEAIFEDVSERKRADQALKESEARLSTIFRTNLVGIGLNRFESGRFVEVNDAFCSIFGYQREEVLGRTAMEVGFLSHPEGRDELLALLRAGEPVDGLILHVRRKSGEPRILEVSSERVQLDGMPHYLVVASDVTERKRTEEERDRLLEQTRQDAQTKERLLHEINHRVKNNLVALLGLLLAERRGTPPDGLPWVGPSIERMSARVNGLLTTHEMLSAGEWAPLSLWELAERLVRRCLEAGLSTGQVSVEVSPCAARISPRQAGNVALVLNELATNTLKYAVPKKEHVRVAVELDEDDAFFTLEYRDDGPGYPAAVVGGAFPSVGLGLVSSLVTGTLRGSLTLSNDRGAVATIRIKKEETKTT